MLALSLCLYLLTILELCALQCRIYLCIPILVQIVQSLIFDFGNGGYIGFFYSSLFLEKLGIPPYINILWSLWLAIIYLVQVLAKLVLVGPIFTVLFTLFILLGALKTKVSSGECFRYALVFVVCLFELIVLIIRPSQLETGINFDLGPNVIFGLFLAFSCSIIVFLRLKTSLLPISTVMLKLVLVSTITIFWALNTPSNANMYAIISSLAYSNMTYILFGLELETDAKATEPELEKLLTEL